MIQSEEYEIKYIYNGKIIQRFKIISEKKLWYELVETNNFTLSEQLFYPEPSTHF